MFQATFIIILKELLPSMSLSEDEQNRAASSMYKRGAGIGGGSGLLSCTCAIVPIVLIAISSSAAAFAVSILGSFDTFFIVLGSSVLVGTIAFDLKRKGALNIEGVKRLKGPIALSVVIFLVITVTLLYGVAPMFLSQFQQAHGN